MNHPLRWIVLVVFFFALTVPVFAQQSGLYGGSCTSASGGSLGTPQPSCPGGSVTDAVPFVVPCGGSIGASVFTAGHSYVGNVANSTVCLTGADGKAYVMQKSNDKHLLFSVSGGMISLVEDTTWTGGETCSNGKPALQRFSTGGINFVSRSLSCGGTTQIQSGAKNVAYEYNPSLETSPMANVPACSAAHAGDLTGSTSQMIFHGPAKCNGQSIDAMVITNIAGAGAGEVFIYCRDKGLCGWYQGIDFNAAGHQPKDWTANTDLCNLDGANTTSACKAPPTGPFLPNDSGDLPKTVTDTDDFPDVSFGQSLQGSGRTLDISSFEGVTFPKFDKENNKFNEMLNPNAGGGELTPAALQGQFVNPSEQGDYGTEDVSGYHGYKEVYGSGCAQSQFSGGKIKSEAKKSDEAAQAKTPNPYPDVQANFHNFASLRVPGESTGLQWQAKQPEIVTQGSDKLTEAYKYRLKECDERALKKQVESVPVKVTGVIQVLLTAVTDIVSSLWNLLSVPRQVCETTETGEQKCHDVTTKSALLETVQTATVFTPGAPDIEKMAVDEKERKHGVFLTFFTDELINRLSNNHAYTTKEGGTNVLAASTDSDGNGKDDFPHYQIHAVKNTFDKTSGCMLIPASMQKDKTSCELPPETSPTPTPTSSVPSATAPNCSMDIFSKTPPPTKGGIDGGPIGKYSGYSIPYRDPSCIIESDKLPALAELPVRWSAEVKRNPDLAQKARQNVMNVFPTIQQKAMEYGWNPAFVLALWIEETAVGQHGDYAMGCKYGKDSNYNWFRMPPKSDGCQAAACLFSYPIKNPNNLEEFMCSYNTGVCQTLAPGEKWPFAENIKLAYTLVSQTAGLSAHCLLREK